VSLLDTAIQYHARGWCVIPANGKMPRFAWKHYQRERPSEQLLGDWFGRQAARNVP
jgi:hypothetical protein